MYQSNKLINEAFIAAVHSLEKIPVYWKLKQIRIQNIFNGKVNSISYKKCTCADDYDKIVTFPYLFPLFPSEGHSYLGEYSVLPFFYLICMNDSKAFPIVELLEVPILDKGLHLSKLEKEKIDSILLGVGSSFIASYKEITKENIGQELNEIRKRAISKVFDMTNSAATIFFSAFSNLPESILLSDKTGYINASSLEQKNISWSFQSNKTIPVKCKNEVLFFTLSSWALSKKEV